MLGHQAKKVPIVASLRTTCTCSLSLYVVVVLLCFMCTCIILIHCELLYPLLFGLSCTCITFYDEMFPFTVASASQHMCKYGCVQTAMFGIVESSLCVDFVIRMVVESHCCVAISYLIVVSMSKPHIDYDNSLHMYILTFSSTFGAPWFLKSVYWSVYPVYQQDSRA